MMIELAIGDSFGAGFEYASRDFVEAHNFKPFYVSHPKHKQRPGRYTDDTQMSIAIAEALIDHKMHGIAFSPEILAGKFVQCFKRDQRVGYASGFYHFLKTISSGAEFLEKIRPDSDKSGAAMRACPLGMLSDLDEVKNLCETQAKLTHNTKDGINAALASALFVWYVRENQENAGGDVAKWLDKEVPGYNWNEPWVGKVGSKGWMSVRAAVTAFLDVDSFSPEQTLYRCVAFTGDVDTVATIAMAAESQLRLWHYDLPQSLYEGLENGNYGMDYLKSLDDLLDDAC